MLAPQTYPQFMGVHPSEPPSSICSIIQMFLNDNLLLVISFFYVLFFFIEHCIRRNTLPVTLRA